MWSLNLIMAQNHRYTSRHSRIHLKRISTPSMLIIADMINPLTFQVGNAIIDNFQDQRGEVDYWWTHALISDETYAQLIPCLNSNSSNCNAVSQVAFNEQGNIDPYDIYTPACLNLTGNLKKGRGRVQLLQRVPQIFLFSCQTVLFQHLYQTVIAIHDQKKFAVLSFCIHT